MNSVREIAKAIISEMEDVQRDSGPFAAEHYRRIAVMTYANYLKRSPERSKEMNQQCLEESYLHFEKAISLGIPEERMEESFARLRDYWLPRLKEASDAKD